jgi:DNA-binding CsgD family transcriptional regulator
LSDVVGRGPEIAAISRWFGADGPPMLVIDGPAGLGKTTVWASAVAAIQSSGALVLVSAPSEAESGLSYSGLADLLAPRLDSIRAALPRPQVRALAVAMRLEEPGDRPADETAVARGLPEAWRALARIHGRILVAIDDLRWLDAPSLAAVVYASRRIGPDDGIRILTTHRTGADEPAGLAGRETIGRLHLEPLSVGGIHRIVRLHAGISLSRPRLLELHATTLGNPLHAIELARAIDAGGGSHGGSLGSLFLARVRALPAGARRGVVLLAASADRSLDRLDRAMPGIRTALEPAVRADLVAFDGDTARPVHPLVANVAYDDAAGPARRAAHRALADSAANDEERALHLGRSVEGTDDAAADVVDAAARTARARGVRALSATLFERAAALTPEAASDRRAARLLAAASAWFDAGDTHRVELILEPLVALLEPSAQRAEARWRLGIALDESGRWPEAVALWKAAIEETDDAALRSQVRCSLAITAMYTESLQGAVDWASSAVMEAEASGEPPALARSLAVQAFILAMAGRTGHEASLVRALAIERTVDESLGEWSPSGIAAEIARQTGDVPAAIRHYATVLDAATSRGDANVEQWAAFGLGQAEVLAGGFRRASELADIVIDIADQTDVMTIPARSLRAHVDAWLGDFASARALVADAIERSRAAAELAHLFGATVVLGAIESCAGRPVEAANAYAAARRMAAELGFAHATARRVELLAAEAAATAGDLPGADEGLAAFDAAVGPEPPAWSVPMRRRAVAAILAARGDLEAAVAELEAALAAEPLPIDEGRTLLALGIALRRLREHRRSREVTELALDRFTELGTPPWIDASTRELGRLPGRRAHPDRELTNAEARIAELVAGGRTNREVAAELVLSVKTIEVTLTRVYEKLGLRSRAELAAHFRPEVRETLGEPL